MSTQLCLLQSALADLFVDVSTSGQVTVADQYGLLAALLDGSLSSEELGAIDRILHSVCKGRVRLVSDLSAIA
ncbi:hypothetical protein H6G89_23165 [Oscillatoria sp. FACHB-1407]|uniref:hypothetical protein n=1 Tax=Oscillatoria sp. FACHB-1407 TaxID=2692847 RepID=UPI001684681C|nr:hypothetical protein [Oscillatoria sp. FACHB-1407]MBD2463906.1 hypothetical protein [Oscillatoria sp. FACHB-1407]